MPNLRSVRECLLFGFEENLLNDEEFILLYDMNASKNPDFPYWQYDPFDLDDLCDNECTAEFHFLKNDIHLLKECYKFLMKLFVITDLLSMELRLCVLF